MSTTPWFKLVSWNLFKWKGVEVHDWPGVFRKQGMEKTITSLAPDIICTQETAPEYLDTLLGVNPNYRCILPGNDVLKAGCEIGPSRQSPFLPLHLRYRRANSGEESFSGWIDEGNIIFDSSKFEYVSHGAEDVGIEESEERKPKRRLFWVRLRILASDKTILVATAHLTWEGGCVSEMAFPFPHIRKQQAMRIIESLGQIRSEDEPIIFSGDMNDSWHVPFTMRENGFIASDFALALPTEPTHPAQPCFHEERIPAQTRDWIFSKGDQINPILSRVCSNMILGLNGHPSDHFPVCSVFVGKNREE